MRDVRAELLPARRPDCRQYYDFLRLGRDGYRHVHQACADAAALLARQVAKLGPSSCSYDGRGALPAISYALRDPAASAFDLYQLSDQLRMRGWQVPAYPLPPDRDATVIHRVLVRHGISGDKLELFFADLRACVEALTRTPAPSMPGRGPAFHH